MVAIVPLKALDDAKSRLGRVSSAPDRRALALTLLGRVVRACAEAGLPVVVVSPDADVHAAARRLGADTLDDGGADLTGAVALALAANADEDAVVVVAADLPFLQAADLVALLAAATPLAIAPAADGTTNAVAARPPSAFTPSYGRGSARRHGGRRVRRPGLEHDLDTPADLATALAAGVLR
jgi:2-phospho-L-lactate guanylyltransferase